MEAAYRETWCRISWIFQNDSCVRFVTVQLKVRLFVLEFHLLVSYKSSIFFYLECIGGNGVAFPLRRSIKCNTVIAVRKKILRIIQTKSFKTELLTLLSVSSETFSSPILPSAVRHNLQSDKSMFLDFSVYLVTSLHQLSGAYGS